MGSGLRLQSLVSARIVRDDWHVRHDVGGNQLPLIYCCVLRRDNSSFSEGAAILVVPAQHHGILLSVEHLRHFLDDSFVACAAKTTALKRWIHKDRPCTGAARGDVSWCSRRPSRGEIALVDKFVNDRCGEVSFSFFRFANILKQEHGGDSMSVET